jgi:exopolyphosphatase/guanosine-5'-triphosphate,3'-diphosphate pyrophosphatase
VGTNALRTAANADEFLRQASDKGFVIDVVPGLDEAALVYAGVISALPTDDTPRLVIDIGGGSTELVVGAGQNRLQSHSMAIGCISWRDSWFSNLPQTESALSQRMDDATQAAADVFAGVSGTLSTTPWQEAYASSGTAKMLSAVCAQKKRSQRTSPGVTLKSLQALKTDIMRTVLEPGYSLPGLKNGRRELILPGWAVLNGFMTACQVTDLQFSPSALREGMLHYLAQASFRGESPLHVLRAQ